MPLATTNRRATKLEPALIGLLREDYLALWSLLRQPRYSVPAALSVALGVGASLAVFAVFSALMLRPLPFPEDGAAHPGGKPQIGQPLLLDGAPKTLIGIIANEQALPSWGGVWVAADASDKSLAGSAAPVLASRNVTSMDALRAQGAPRKGAGRADCGRGWWWCRWRRPRRS